MADVSKIFKPRRGKVSTMAGTKATTVLAAGEMFVEVPDTGVGTGHSKIKLGDGTTAYSSLPYAMGDTSNDTVTFTSDSSTTVANALNNVASGNALKTLIAGLKQAVSLESSSITTLNDDGVSLASRVSTIENTLSGGVGMTTEQANQLSTLYNQLVLYEGDKVLLWTNSNTTSAFSAQTITISGGFSSYRYLIIECYVNTDSNYHSDANTNTEYNFRSTSATEAFYMSAGGNRFRQATINVSAGTVIFAGGNNTNVADSTACIPYKIFGI